MSPEVVAGASAAVGCLGGLLCRSPPRKFQKRYCHSLARGSGCFNGLRNLCWGDVGEGDEDKASTPSQQAVDLDDSIRPGLINDLVRHQWQYISAWFDDKMRRSVEPVLQSFMPHGFVIKFGTRCSLGAIPLELTQVHTTKYQEDSIGTKMPNLRVVAEIDFDGTPEVDVELSGGHIVSTSLTIHTLKLKGKVVIDIVQFIPKPPFMSGLRISFPDKPELTIEVTAGKLLTLPFNVSFIEQMISKSLVQVISDQVVFPNCLPIKFSAGDTLALTHPIPVGVLRVTVKKAEDLEAPGYIPIRRWFSGWFSRSLASDFPSDPYVEVNVGASQRRTEEVRRCKNPEWDHDGSTFDFLVYDPERQHLCIEVRDNDYGIMSSKISDFMGRKKFEVRRIKEKGLVEIEGFNWIFKKSGFCRNVDLCPLQLSTRQFALGKKSLNINFFRSHVQTTDSSGC
jgi:hypothetical protein